MKFIVTHGPLNETNVTLPRETRRTIKKIVGYTTLAVFCVFAEVKYDAYSMHFKK